MYLMIKIRGALFTQVLWNSSVVSGLKIAACLQPDAIPSHFRSMLYVVRMLYVPCQSLYERLTGSERQVEDSINDVLGFFEIVQPLPVVAVVNLIILKCLLSLHEFIRFQLTPSLGQTS